MFFTPTQRSNPTFIFIKGIGSRRLSLIVGETNILQQILWKLLDRFRRYGHVCVSQCLALAAAIL